MMNKNAKKWVDALRSGEFKQTVEVLNDKNGYCCLGVACSVYEKETGEMLPRGKNGFYERCFLDESIVEWLGLGSCSGDFLNTDESLVYYNDDRKYDFNKIADIIEKNQEELFTKGENNE